VIQQERSHCAVYAKEEALSHDIFRADIHQDKGEKYGYNAQKREAIAEKVRHVYIICV